MVRLRSTEPVTYELLDEEGRPLGQVTLPRDTTIVGRQAATVLLHREIPRARPKPMPVIEATRAA